MTLISQLNTLEGSGLIRLAQVQPELEYLFRHALVQEAAYSSVLKHDRKRLHLDVGETLEQLYAGRLEEILGTLAHHFAAAGERDKGVAYARRAAQRAVTMYAYEEALQHLRGALDLLGAGEPSETRLAVLEELADVHRLLAERTQALEIYQQALDLWHGTAGADRIAAIRLHRKIIQTVVDLKWWVDFERFATAAQVTLGLRAGLKAELQSMEGAPPHAETIRLLSVLSTVAWRIETTQDWDAAQRYAEAAVRMAEQLGDPVELSAALGTLATVLLARGVLREHVQVALRRLKVGMDPRFGDLRERIEGLSGAGVALMYVGEYAKAIPHLQDAVSLAAPIHAVDQQVGPLAVLSQCWFRMDRWDEVLETHEKLRDLVQRYSREQTGPT